MFCCLPDTYNINRHGLQFEIINKCPEANVEEVPILILLSLLKLCFYKVPVRKLNQSSTYHICKRRYLKHVIIRSYPNKFPVDLKNNLLGKKMSASAINTFMETVKLDDKHDHFWKFNCWTILIEYVLINYYFLYASANSACILYIILSTSCKHMT